MSLFDGQPIIPGDGIDRAAVLSPCKRYRYSLTRRWRFGPPVVFIGLNPSTADAHVDDPTIRRCIGFARSWLESAIEMVNLFAFRSTDPSALPGADDPVGPRNDDALLEACDLAPLVIAAWGAHPSAVERATRVVGMLRGVGVKLHHLGLTKDGHPRHPLYLPADTRPTRWTP